ncbi:hypothetical protein [Paraburkholderia caribensis]|uniref:hypothetical protein n=1 Tax=Paraburkholderia caribensis TaxID=75105 RepID=UPI001CAF6249|nr:hypothetical protein [Paraburkholderia caribensis]CAG9243835.1 conserved hypothetical protein [Paraburkholderia caribensis]
MSRLGIDRNTGQVYEGKEDPRFLAVPMPVVSQCKLIESPSDLGILPGGLDRDPFAWIFREESFDPVSRVRRGRIFQSLGNSGWEAVLVDAHPFASSDYGTGRNDGRVLKQLCVYTHCSELLNKARRGEGMRLAIGVAGSFSQWRILQTESTVNQDVIVTLRSESTMGILPALDESKVHPENLVHVKQAFERVLDAAYRELPTSVVDQCRNLCAVLASRWLYQISENKAVLSEDLGRCITAVQRQFGQDSHRLLRSALEIVNTLHPRGKDNERHRFGLRCVTEDDASLAVHATAFIVREIGWAQ